MQILLDEFTFGEVMRHVIAHEIHPIGQLSIWVKELGFDPVSANVIGRGIGRSTVKKPSEDEEKSDSGPTVQTSELVGDYMFIK